MTPELTEALKKLAMRNFRIASFKQPKFMGMKTLDINEREKLLTPVGRMTVLELQKLCKNKVKKNHSHKHKTFLVYIQMTQFLFEFQFIDQHNTRTTI